MTGISLKSVVHHGAECAAFLVAGTYAFSSLSGTCVAYGAGKVSYLGTKMILDSYAPQMQKSTVRIISWGVSLLVGGGTMQVFLGWVKGQSVNVLATAGTTVGVTVVSVGVRAVCDKVLKLSKPFIGGSL